MNEVIKIERRDNELRTSSRNLTTEQKLEHVRLWKESGLSQREYAKLNNIGRGSMQSWCNNKNLSYKFVGTKEERFNEKTKLNKKTGCLEWVGSTTNNGYGRIYIDGRDVLTHRFAYERVNGSIKDGLYVLHRCDNPKCCNVDHLFLGTQKDNIRDMYQKGRENNVSLKGEDNPNSKLTLRDLMEIKDLYKSGLFFQKEIGVFYGISQTHVGRITSGKRT